MDSGVERFRVYPQDTLAKVMSVINSVGLGIALVVSDEGKFLGVITDGDIRRALLKGVDLDDTIENIFTRNPIVLPEGFSFGDARVLQLLQSDIFRRRNPRLIPVIDGEGWLTRLISIEELSYPVIAKDSARKQLAANYLGNVLVIGGAGYIGAVLVRKLLEAGYHVRVLDLLLYGEDSLRELRDHPAFEFIQGDIRHIEMLVSAIQNADCVIHLAELVGDPLCASSPVLTLQINYLSTLTIARICSYLAINRFVYASSCSVYGASADPGNVLDEDSALAPLSLYAKMKINSERAIMSMSGSNFSPCILRLGTVFGVSPRPRFDLVVNSLTAQAIFEGEVRIFGGSQWRPHVHVSDVAHAVQLVLKSPIERVGGKVFNIVGENHRVDTLGELISARLPTTHVIPDHSVTDLRNYRVSSNKAEKVLDFHPLVTVTDGIDEMVRYLEGRAAINYKDKRYHNVQALTEWVQDES